MQASESGKVEIIQVGQTVHLVEETTAGNGFENTQQLHYINRHSLNREPTIQLCRTDRLMNSCSQCIDMAAIKAITTVNAIG